MQTFSHTIADPLGIHARPAGKLAQCAAKFKSQITVEKAGKNADGKRLLALMCLGARCGDTLVFSIQGEDETAALAALQTFCEAELS